MPPNTQDAAFLWDMLDAAQAVQKFVSGKALHDYQNDRMLRGAVERHIEIIGEAARKVSKEFCDSNTQIPWQSIITQRNVIAHEYGEIENELIWKVATDHIPDLINKLKTLIPPAPLENC